MALAVVQAKKIETGGSGSVTVNGALTATAGNLMATASSAWNETTADAVSDNANGTYTRIGQCLGQASAFTGAWHYAKNITGGSLNLTVTPGTSSGACEGFWHEVSGADTTAPFTSGEFAHTDNAANSTSHTTAQVTNSVADSIFFALLQDGAGGGTETMTVNGASSSPAGWALKSSTDSQETDANNFIPASVAFLVVSSSAASKHQWTGMSNSSHGSAITCFKIASGGAAAPVGRLVSILQAVNRVSTY